MNYAQHICNRSMRCFVQSASYACLLATILLLIMSNVAFAGNFTCKRIEERLLPYKCSLDPSSSFLGVSLKMETSQAFRKLCKSASDSVWSVYVPNTNPPQYTPATKWLHCTDWLRFAHSNFWLLRSSGYPCVGSRYIVMLIAQNQLSDITVRCEVVAPDTLH